MRRARKRAKRAASRPRREAAAEPLFDAHSTYRDMWEALSPRERFARSWAMRGRLPNIDAYHDEKTFPFL